MKAFIHGEINEYIQWHDTDGNIINASDGGIIYADGKYHWYGQALRPLSDKEGGQKTTRGVVMYGSENLLDWKYEGVILATSDASAIDVFYETVSATATVGLSRNFTASLNAFGKIIIIVTMYFGRVGPISLAVALGRKNESQNVISEPTEDTSIG